MKTKISTLFLAISALLFAGSMYVLTPAPAHAANPAADDLLQFTDDTAVAGGLKKEGAPDREVYDIIAGVLNVIIGLTGIVFFVQMFWAGSRWMTAGGNETVIEEAKSTIKHTIIGVVITLLAFGITNFIFNQVARVAG